MNVCRFSACRTYRYTLLHQWDTSKDAPRVMWIGLNPSTADEQQLDPTLRKIKEFSRRMGYGVFVMCNLYAYRSTDPKALWEVDDPVCPGNLVAIEKEMPKVGRVMCAWGRPGPDREMPGKMRNLIWRNDLIPVCLGTNKDGSPSHPLYLPYDRINSQKLYAPRPADEVL
jgi:hypothetical protein